MNWLKEYSGNPWDRRGTFLWLRAVTAGLFWVSLTVNWLTAGFKQTADPTFLKKGTESQHSLEWEHLLPLLLLSHSTLTTILFLFPPQCNKLWLSLMSLWGCLWGKKKSSSSSIKSGSQTIRNTHFFLNVHIIIKYMRKYTLLQFINTGVTEKGSTYKNISGLNNQINLFIRPKKMCWGSIPLSHGRMLRWSYSQEIVSLA